MPRRAAEQARAGVDDPVSAVAPVIHPFGANDDLGVGLEFAVRRERHPVLVQRDLGERRFVAQIGFGLPHAFLLIAGEPDATAGRRRAVAAVLGFYASLRAGVMQRRRNVQSSRSCVRRSSKAAPTMHIGVPKEIKVLEHRVGLTAESVREARTHGHDVIVETCAGQGIGMDDDAYRRAGATIAATAAEVFARADMIVKVKEPQAAECKMLRRGQLLFTYLHLAPDPEQAAGLIASGAVCIAYETVTSKNGGLPLLAPMSEVAGRMSIQAGAYFLEKAHGGLGVLLGGVPGVDPAKVVILGGGVIGSHACHIALGMGAEVWVLDRNTDVLRALWRQFGRPLNTVFSTHDAIERHVTSGDLVVGGVLIPGASAPKLVSAALVKQMKKGSVIVDVAIDQGG